MSVIKQQRNSYVLKMFAKAYFANIVEQISVISDLGPITLYQIFVLVLEVLNAT